MPTRCAAGDGREFRAFVWALACQCGLESAREVVFAGDGAAWIWEQIAPILGEKTICITDWYHVTEHLWDCGRTLFGEGSEAAEAWVEEVQVDVVEGQGVGSVGRIWNSTSVSIAGPSGKQWRD